MGKAYCDRKHATRRALERYGFSYNRDHLREIRAKLAKGEYLTGERDTRARTVFTMLYLGMKIRFVYSKTTKEIVTFLPLEGNDEDLLQED